MAWQGRSGVSRLRGKIWLINKSEKRLITSGHWLRKSSNFPQAKKDPIRTQRDVLDQLLGNWEFQAVGDEVSDAKGTVELVLDE